MIARHCNDNLHVIGAVHILELLGGVPVKKITLYDDMMRTIDRSAGRGNFFPNKNIRGIGS